MADLERSITEHPHAEVHSTIVADWLEQQGQDRWWFADDYFLAGLVSLPGPTDKLAAMFRLLNRPLLVGRHGEGAEFLGVLHSAEELAPFVVREDRYEPPHLWNERILNLRWKDRDADWQLEEDSATADGEARDAALAEEDD